MRERERARERERVSGRSSEYRADRQRRRHYLQMDRYRFAVGF